MSLNIETNHYYDHVLEPPDYQEVHAGKAKDIFSIEWFATS